MAQSTTEMYGEDGASSRPDANRAISTIERRATDGSLALLGGGAMFAWALRTSRKRRGRAALLALASLAVLGIGLRRRRSGRRPDPVETGADVRLDEEGAEEVSDEAQGERDRDLGAGRNADESRSVYQSDTEPNPRGMSDRSDVETDDAGEIDFVEGKEPGTHREPHLEDEDAHDTRLHPESDDEPTEVDLSESAMADEASEAAGPQPEQAYPAREGTDPEPTSDEAPERVDEGTTAPADSDTGERQTGDEPQERHDGSEEAADEPDQSS